MTCERIGEGSEGDAVVEDDVRLTGVHRGTVTVVAGASLVLAGTVSGDVINDGGDVEVYGSIDGRLVYEGGTTYVDSGAAIDGGVVEPDDPGSDAPSE